MIIHSDESRGRYSTNKKNQIEGKGQKLKAKPQFLNEIGVDNLTLIFKTITSNSDDQKLEFRKVQKKNYIKKENSRDEFNGKFGWNYRKLTTDG